MRTFEYLHCFQVFGTLYMNEGLDKQLAVERAVSVFANLDVDGDGDITEVNQLFKASTY